MKIIYSGVEFESYDKRRPRSFEYNNFFLSLKTLPNTEVIYIPFERILKIGRKKFNEELVAVVCKEHPDLFFAFMYTDEFDPAALDKIKKKTTSIAWFSDDSWRFWNYSRLWAPHFTWAVTTYSWTPALFRKYGQPNVIRSQWAANISLYKPMLMPEGMPRPEVAFVGGWSGPRGKIVDAIRKAGIPVEVYGGGWPDARRATEDEMIRFFGASKISLALNPPPGFFNKNSLGRILFRRSREKIVPDFHFYSNVRSWLNRGIPQIKGRHFEIPACGGFLLTGKADDLETFYAPDKEIVLFDGIDDYIEKIRYYLAHDAEREAIAKAGYERTVREHTYQRRFEEIFRQAGLIA